MIRSRLVWKLIAVVVVILAMAIGLSGYINSLICDFCSMESARAFLRFNSESNIKGIGQLMMKRDIEGVKTLIGDISQESKVYGDIRLIAHHTGEVVASRFGEGGDRIELTLEDQVCAMCHGKGSLNSIDPVIVGEVTPLPNGGRNLSVMAPILNKPTCRTADCHAHLEGPPILGFFNSNYSLEQVDTTIAKGRGLITATVLGTLLVGIVALWLVFTWMLQRPISALIAGTERIAANQLDFRFEQTGNDEIGVLATSFNTMIQRIQAHRDELRSAMEYLAGMIENSADIIITVTPDGYIETFNQGAEKSLGYNRVEVIGRQIESLFVDPPERRMIAERLKDTGNIRNYETRLLAKDGQVCHVMLTLSHMRDKEGNPIGTIGISKDITQEKKLQRELLQSQKFAAIGQAMTGIQHAIKNMLNALKGGSYLARAGMAKDNPQRIEEGWAMIDEGIEQISNLSYNMLNYVKNWKLEPRSVDLNDMVAKICEANRQTAADKGVTLQYEPAGRLPHVVCDPKLIHMAVTDMLVNAIDACGWKDYGDAERPKVVLKNSLTELGDVFEILVRDNGCGMDAEIQRNIFNPFFSTKKTQGTGLGLALTARVIKVHMGKIIVESEPDRGTTFRIHLPIDGPKNGSEVNDG